MGGHQTGEVASWIAVESLKNLLSAQELNKMDSEKIKETILGAIFTAHKEIKEMAKKDINLARMGTTVVLACGVNDKYYISHVGDSRAYLIHNKTITQLTNDHTVVAELLKAKMITPEEGKTHHMKHVLTQALGSETQIIPSIQEITFEEGGILLLCTDGLTDMLTDEEILSIINEYSEDIEKILKKLLKPLLIRQTKKEAKIILRLC
jgi:protein phosphatase